MPLDRSKLHKGYQSYLGAAEKNSGKTFDDMHLVLSTSGLKTHGELRSHLMDEMGLGHGHANAVVHIWREFSGGDALMGSAPAKSAPAKKKPAKKPAAKKKPVKKPAAKK